MIYYVCMFEIAAGVMETTTDLRLSPGFWMPARCTALACGDGRVALISPLPLTDDDARTLDGLGNVAWVVAPNGMHHLHVRGAAERFPEARVLLARGLEAKVPSGVASEPLEGAGFGAEVRALTVAGAPALAETVFLHVPSKTLVVTDLVFNLRETKGLLTPLILTVVGARGRFAQSRALRFMVKDRDALALSFEEILAMDFDRIVMAHGEVLASGAKDALAGALGWARRTQLAVSR